MTKLKKCSICGMIHPANNKFFYENKAAKSGLHSYCKECFKIYNKKTYKDSLLTTEEALAKIKENEWMSRVCPECGESYPASLDYWHMDRRQSCGLSKICKKCRNEYRKKFD